MKIYLLTLIVFMTKTVWSQQLWFPVNVDPRSNIAQADTNRAYPVSLIKQEKEGVFIYGWYTCDRIKMKWRSKGYYSHSIVLASKKEHSDAQSFAFAEYCFTINDGAGTLTIKRKLKPDTIIRFIQSKYAVSEAKYIYD